MHPNSILGAYNSIYTINNNVFIVTFKHDDFELTLAYFTWLCKDASRFSRDIFDVLMFLIHSLFGEWES